MSSSFTSNAEVGSEDSHFSDAAREDGLEAGAASRERHTTSGRKRKKKPTDDCEKFDDSEFTFAVEGELEENLTHEIDDIHKKGLTDGGGKRKKHRGRQQQKAGAGRAGPPRRQNARGSAPPSSGFLDQAEEIQSREGGGSRTAGRRGESRSMPTKASLTATPKRNASNRQDMKGKRTGSNLTGGWISRELDGPKLHVGALGMIGQRSSSRGKPPSKETARSKHKTVQDARRSRKEEVVEITSDDDHVDVETSSKYFAKGVEADSGKRKAVDEQYSPSPDRDGIKWDQSSSSGSEGEDFLAPSTKGTGLRPSSSSSKTQGPPNDPEIDSQSPSFSFTKVASNAVSSAVKGAQKLFGQSRSKKEKSQKCSGGYIQTLHGDLDSQSLLLSLWVYYDGYILIEIFCLSFLFLVIRTVL